MRLFALGFILVSSFTLSSGLPGQAQSQMEMTAQSWAEFEKADKELNTLYQKILKSIDDDITKQKFIAAQKTWIKFRDAEAELAADSERGGSLENQMRAISETETTQARIVELKKFLADFQGK